MSMKWRRVFLLSLTVSLTQVVLNHTVTANYEANLYPPEGESIMIPIMGNLLGECLLLPFYLSVALLPLAKHFKKAGSTRYWPNRLLLGWVGISYLTLLLNAVGTFLRWTQQSHYSITIAQFGVVLSLLFLLLIDLRCFIRGRRAAMAHFRNPLS